ncbi:CHRD domain-containing protein [Demetria terragena]|uniref:CHRD domain-containing protein n=1 Tax=Demetria terragena TaxID=63959 RepID=UPI00035DC173|nr:CHRD domain-containing protein [Demetria terragena]
MSVRQHCQRAGVITGLAALGGFAFAGPAAAETEVDRPSTFTSAFTVMATPDAVIDPDGNSAPGEPGTSGTFTFMINSDEEIICYDITTKGVTPPYQSKAKTATHLHEAVAGKGGPPRISFPNPEGSGDTRTSKGCLKGPFTTGLPGPDGADTGTGFSLKQIEANAAGFSADTHTSAFVPGAVRGQLKAIPVGGVDTGFGGTANQGQETSAPVLGLGAGAVLLAGGAVVVMARRNASGRA